MPKLPQQEKAFLYKYLSQTLLSSLSITAALEYYLQDVHPKHQKVLSKILTDLRRKQFLWQALKSSRCFTPIEIYIFKLVEESSRDEYPEVILSQTFKKFYKFIQNEIALKKKIIGLIIYPCFLFFLFTAFLFILTFWVLPHFTAIVGQLHLQYPFIVSFLLKIRTLILKIKQPDNLPYVLITIAALWFLWQIITTEKIKTILSFLSLHAPITGRILRTKCFYHLSFYLSLLPKNASVAVEQKLIEALPFVKSSLANLYMRNFLNQTVIILKKGGRLSDFWRLPTKNFSFKIFQGRLNRQFIPAVFRRLVEIGEKTNTLNSEFHYCLIILREELETEIKFTLSYFEPIFILLIALLVSLTAISLYSMISQIYSQTL